ncbi:RodZ domain-containing protein [Quatrionicoccus australiensis]|uniref:RodZ domain-containing protein n=1 Tax=Quatrionicoccus australiensis TaxID=138118 RepID=UPI001CF88E15|nr:RodZ domain-containing protein [Quatrionicoccus australiensis]UCV16364.1 helix-turn-helix domain-containing protein [Quatrionicoccus australiensis]
MSEEMDIGERAVEDAGQDVLPVMPAVGAQLRAAREARGIALSEVAATLKLGVRQLEALERGDWQVLPGATFVRGFVRNYARFVQINPLPLMSQLDAVLEKPVSRLGEADSQQTAMPQGGPGISRRDRMVVLSGGLLVVFAALIYFLLPNDLSVWRDSVQELISSLARKDEVAPVAVVEPAPASEPVFPPGTTPQQVMNPQAETPAADAVAPQAAMPVAEKSLQVAGAPDMRFVFEKESWVEVRDRDGKVIFSQRGQAVSEQSVSGQGPFSLVVGFAPGVKLFWHGQTVDLAPYTRGDVARLVLE